MKLNIYSTIDEVLAGLAEYFILSANNAITLSNRFIVALSGGTSPKKFYSLLVSSPYRERVDWTKVYFFFGDERYVPASNPASNYQMVKKVLFEPLAISDSHVFIVDTMLPPQESAEQYWKDISFFFKDREPRFDLVLLGLGDNSHTASLFPNTPVLHETEATIKAVFLPDQQVYRITFTAGLINKARRIAFLVYGESKAQAVYNILKEDTNIENFPAQLVKPVDGELEWFLDQPAARKISQS